MLPILVPTNIDMKYTVHANNFLMVITDSGPNEDKHEAHGKCNSFLSGLH